MALHDRDYMKEDGGSRWSGIMWPDAVTLIIIVNVVVFLLQHAFGIGWDHMRDAPWGALSIQALLEGRVWTIFTHMFVHDGILHIIGNCLLIAFAGKAVQHLIGSRQFLNIYFLSGLVAAATELLAGWLQSESDMTSLVGASGAGFGILLALGVMLPQETITTLVYFVIPVRIRIWTLAMICVGIAAVMAVLQVTKLWSTDIASFAHLGGALAGWWYVRLLGYGGPPITYDSMWNERQRREEKRAYAGVGKRVRTRDNQEPEVEMPPLTKKQLIEQEIDPILDKIAAHGMESLSEEERNLLARASDEVRKHKG